MTIVITKRKTTKKELEKEPEKEPVQLVVDVEVPVIKEQLPLKKKDYIEIIKTKFPGATVDFNKVPLEYLKLLYENIK